MAKGRLNLLRLKEFNDSKKANSGVKCFKNNQKFLNLCNLGGIEQRQTKKLYSRPAEMNNNSKRVCEPEFQV